MAGVTANPILTARYVAFPEPVRPLNHVPRFTPACTPGFVFCLRCEREITSKQWAGEPCPGRAVAP